MTEQKKYQSITRYGKAVPNKVRETLMNMGRA